MKKVQFAQALDVEVWITIEVPDDFTEDDIQDYVQDFPMEVTIVEPQGQYEHIDTEIYVHTVDYHGAAEVQGDKTDD